MVQLRERWIAALIEGASALLTPQSFEKTARIIFDLCRRVTGAKSGYVALLSDSGEENELLFLEAGGLSCTVNESLSMPVRGLREWCYKYNKVVVENDFMNSKWVNLMPAGHVVLDNVLFAPLTLEGKVVGIIGLANKRGDFDENDKKLAGYFGKISALALRNSRHMEQIQTLKSMLPICMNCKKVRDDEGYWKGMEEFIETHPDILLNHSLCPDCMKKLHPEVKISEE